MAYTSIHPISYSVSAAILYITDPDKTDGKMLVSSYACSPETAHLEYAQTAALGSGFGKVKAQHVIQSFAKGEVTPELAHEIGEKLAQRITEGKYQYVLSTHINTGMVHNHIIFNQVDFIDYKKFRGNIRSQRMIARESDDLCKAYGLSVITPSGKGIPYQKYASPSKKPSFK